MSTLFLLSSAIVFAVGLYHFINGVILGHSDRPTHESAFHFTILMFISAFLYHLEQNKLVALFDALQMVGANKDYEAPNVNGLAGSVAGIYGLLLYVFAPASTAILIVAYLSEFFSPLLVRMWTCRCDAFVFSQLDSRSLRLAQSIREQYREQRLIGRRHRLEAGHGPAHTRYPCIVFSSVDSSFEKDVSAKARGLGAICTARDVEDILSWCSARTLCTVFLSSQSETENISRAQRIKESAKTLEGRFDVFLQTSLRNAEALLLPETSLKVGTTRSNVIVRGFNETRELVNYILEAYPLFLVSNPRSPWKPCDKRGAQNRLRDLYCREKRHIVIVGAGNLGFEFATSAVWASRIDGINTCIDVIDYSSLCQENACISTAEERFRASSPGIASRICKRWSMEAKRQDECYDLHFSCMDVASDSYVNFLTDSAETITYVFVALENDLLAAKVAMRTRQILERALIARLGKEAEHTRQDYLNANRPLIVAVIEDNELADIIANAKSENQSYDIVCIRESIAQPDYSDLLKLKSAHREYDRQSNRANAIHRKYRLFAWLRNSYLGNHGIEKLDDEQFFRIAQEIDWTTQPSDDWEALRMFEQYRLTEEDLALLKTHLYPNAKQSDCASCTDTFTVKTMGSDKGNDARLARLKTRTYPLDEHGAVHDGKTSREWLLRMEHARWNAYIRAEGFEAASLEEVTVLFDTGQTSSGDKLHRSNLAGLHPCLVPFDELKGVTVNLQALYQEVDPERALLDMRLLDDRYVGFKSVQNEQDAIDYLDLLSPAKIEENDAESIGKEG